MTSNEFIVRGNPSPEEIAAIVVTLVRPGRRPDPAPRPRAEWMRGERRLRAVPTAAAWRTSALPR